MSIVVTIVSIIAGVVGFNYFWTKITNARALAKALARRQKLKIVLDAHEKRKEELDKEAGDVLEKMDNYHGRFPNDPSGNGPTE